MNNNDNISKREELEFSAYMLPFHTLQAMKAKFKDLIEVEHRARRELHFVKAPSFAALIHCFTTAPLHADLG